MEFFCQSVPVLIFSSQFYTTITYLAITSDGYSIPSACFNPGFIQSINRACGAQNKYLAEVPVGYIPSFIDLKGNHSQSQTNCATIIISALQRLGIDGKGNYNESCGTMCF